MSDHRVEIRSRTVGDRPAADPDRLVVAHHRADEAELRIGLLSGGHLLHLAVAGCVFNSVFRLAEDRGIFVSECRVAVDGSFDDASPRSTGINYEIELSGTAADAALEAVARDADRDSTIPNLLRASTEVRLRNVTVHPVAQADS